MDIMITEKLKEFRKNRGNTQEELANHLSISVQAVSKWERGDGFPDISLLPRIAFFYDVTVDELLGCDIITKNEEIDKFLISCHEINNKGDMKGWLELCLAMQKKYPNDERVLRELMYALGQNGRKKNAKEIIKIGEKLILSTDNNIRDSAIQMLTYTYSAIDEKESALKYAKMIPVLEDYMVTVLEGEELAEHCRWNLWRFSDMIHMQINYFLSSNATGYSNAEKHKLHEMIDNIYHLIFSDGDLGFWEGHLGRNKFSMAVLSAKCGDYNCAISELEQAFAHFENFENFTSIDHTSLPVRGIHYEAAMTVKTFMESISHVYLEKLSQNCFDAIRADEKFISLVNRVKMITSS